jgi:hypothetical protein
MDLGFGVEFEVAGMDTVRAASILRETGHGDPMSNGTPYRQAHEPSTYWKSVSDGSIPYGGSEIVSPVLAGTEAGIDQAVAVATLLKANGARRSASCGMHVHVAPLGRRFTPIELERIAAFWLKWESVIEVLLHDTRLGNRYCRPLRRDVRYSSFVTLPSSALPPSAGDGWDRSSRIRAVSLDRYRMLNFQALERHGTVEIRCYRGTVNTNEVRHWIRFCLMLIGRACKRMAPAPGKKFESGDVSTLMWNLIKPLPADTTRYLWRRIYQPNC